ncbi:MAG: FxLYD domain-containing protein [Anaerovoracaceae bacterium]
MTNERSLLLKKFYDEYGLSVSEKNKDTFDSIIAEGELFEQVKELQKNVKFEKVKNDYGWKEYRATVKNNMDTNFDYFSFNISLEDKSGVVVENISASTSNWKKGSTHRFVFTTSSNLKKNNY